MWIPHGAAASDFGFEYGGVMLLQSKESKDNEQTRLAGKKRRTMRIADTKQRQTVHVVTSQIIVLLYESEESGTAPIS